MQAVIDVLLNAGRSAIEVALHTLLPIMIVMMILMRLLEVHGALDRLIRVSAPLVRPFGLTGLGVVAMLQISFVSFVAPITTLALMDDRRVSNRRLASAFAAVLAMAPANAVFPLASLGLAAGRVLAPSLLGVLSGASACYWIIGRRLSVAEPPISAYEEEALKKPPFLSVVNISGREAIEIVINIIPVLLRALTVVFALQRVGIIAGLTTMVAPAFSTMGITGPAAAHAHQVPCRQHGTCWSHAAY